MIRAWFMALGLAWQLAIEAALFAGVAGAVWAVHHHIDAQGYGRCQAEYKAAADLQAGTAQAEIVKGNMKYAEISKSLRAESGYLRPVSPLVGAAIGRLPQPSPSPK